MKENANFGSQTSVDSAVYAVAVRFSPSLIVCSYEAFTGAEGSPEVAFNQRL